MCIFNCPFDFSYTSLLVLFTAVVEAMVYYVSITLYMRAKYALNFYVYYSSCSNL